MSLQRELPMLIVPPLPRPHMQKLYGDRLRKDGGLTKTLKVVAGKHAKALESRAGKHAPEIKRVFSEVKDIMDRVEVQVTDAVEDFLHLGQSGVDLAPLFDRPLKRVVYQLALASKK